MIHDTARIVRFTGLLSAALSTGVFFGTRISLGPSSKSFAPTTYVEVQQATIRNLRPVMAPLLPGERRGEPGGVGPLGPGAPLTRLCAHPDRRHLPARLRHTHRTVRAPHQRPGNDLVAGEPSGGLGGREGALGDRPHRQDRNLGRRARMLGGRGADISGALRQRPCLGGSDSGRLNSSLGVTYRHILTIAESAPYTP